jgi:hypothetical protein
MPDYTGSLTGPLNFSNGKVTLHQCYFTYAIKDGKFVEPNGLQTKCAPDAVIDPIVAKITKK